MRGIFDSSSKRKPSHKKDSSSDCQSYPSSNSSASHNEYSSNRHRRPISTDNFDIDYGRDNNPASSSFDSSNSIININAANNHIGDMSRSFSSPYDTHGRSSEIPTDNFSSQSSHSSESFGSVPMMPQVPQGTNYPYNNQQGEDVYPTTQNLQRVFPSSSSFMQVQAELAPPLPPISPQQLLQGERQSHSLLHSEQAVYANRGGYSSVSQRNAIQQNLSYEDMMPQDDMQKVDAGANVGISRNAFAQNPSQNAWVQEGSPQISLGQNAPEKHSSCAFNETDVENNSDLLSATSNSDDDFIFGPRSTFNAIGEKEDSLELQPTQKGLTMTKYRRKKNILWIVLVTFGSLIILCFGAWLILRFSFPNTYNALVQQITNIGREDYTGPGYGSVDFTVNEGESLQAVADDLASKQIVASSKFFIRKAIEMKASSRVQPGIFHLKYHMNSADVLSILINPAKASGIVNVLSNSRVANVIESIKASSSWSLESIKEAFGKENASILPPEAHGSFEGWLGLGTYSPKKYSSPKELAKYMVSVRIKHLNEWNVPQGEQREKILIIASIIGGEVNNPADYGKVSRVIENRLAKNMPLGMDSVVAYGNGVLPSQITKSMLVNPNNPYSSRIRKGLPPTPINQPNQAMINAAMNPTPGDWLYFVTVNLHTGETKFTDNYQQFEQYKKQYEEWQANNPS